MKDYKSPLKDKLKSYLFLGILTAGPLLVTLWLIIAISKFLDNLIFTFIPGHDTMIKIYDVPIYGVGLLASLVLFIGIGFFAEGVLGKALNTIADHFFMAIPGVRGIYKTTKQITSNLFNTKGATSFKKVVYVPFPSPNAKSIGFVTSQINEKEFMVFVPTAPNPTSGYVLIYGVQEIQDCPMSINEALQIVVSCGALGPEKR